MTLCLVSSNYSCVHYSGFTRPTEQYLEEYNHFIQSQKLINSYRVLEKRNLVLIENTTQKIINLNSNVHCLSEIQNILNIQSCHLIDQSMNELKRNMMDHSLFIGTTYIPLVELKYLSESCFLYIKHGRLLVEEHGHGTHFEKYKRTHYY